MSGERVTRRLAAIFAADVVGYSRLMGRDENGTLARLREHRKQRFEPILARHGGRLVKLMGDGALAEFPSAVDALGAAIEFQQVMSEANRDQPEDTRIVFRIGLHLGDLIVDRDDLYGDGVNVAARLEAEAPAGGILVSGDVRNAVAGRLKATFEDQGELALKNIERPVRAWRARWAAADWQAVVAATPPKDEPLALPDKPSIAVLPFTSMSGDPEQEYFADGVTEDIITELSRFHELFVISRNSTFIYKGRAVDVRSVATDLGVRYVLEGSVRKAATRIRVTGQLIDALTGNHIWAERYDRVLEDVFAVQEELTQSIVSAITPHINEAEAARVRRRRPGNLSAYEIAVRANAKAWESYVKGDHALRDEAIGDARAALAIDAGSTLALNTIALVQAQHLVLATADRETAWRDGLAAAARSVELDRTGGIGHTWKGVFLALAPDQTRMDEALANAQRGHELNPHAMLSLFGLAFVEVQVGKPEQAIEHARQGLRISPRDPFCHMLHHQLARASFCLGRYADGVRHALLGIDEAPESPVLYPVLAANHVGLGEIDKAAAAMETARRLAPELIDNLRTNRSHVGWVYNLEFRRRYQTFLRVAAGLEDPVAAESLR